MQMMRGVLEGSHKRKIWGGREGGVLVLLLVRDGFGVDLWKPIRKLGHLVYSRFSFVVGDGQRVKLWKDKWCGDTSPSISLLYLLLFPQRGRG